MDEHSEHSSADDRTNGEHTRMKYRRFRTPVNFVMFRTPTLRTEATQINTINGEEFVVLHREWAVTVHALRTRHLQSCFLTLFSHSHWVL